MFAMRPVNKISIQILVCGLNSPVHPSSDVGSDSSGSVPFEEKYGLLGREADNHNA